MSYLQHISMWRTGILSSVSSSTSGVFSGSSRWCFSLGCTGPWGPSQSTGAKGRHQTCCILLYSLHLRQIQLWLTGRALSLIHLVLASLPSVLWLCVSPFPLPDTRHLFLSLTVLWLKRGEKLCDREICSISVSLMFNLGNIARAGVLLLNITAHI